MKITPHIIYKLKNWKDYKLGDYIKVKFCGDDLHKIIQIEDRSPLKRYIIIETPNGYKKWSWYNKTAFQTLD